MTTSTASALLFAGVVLAALPCVDGSRSRCDRIGSTVVSACAWSVALLMLGTLAEYLAKTNLGFSSFFVAEPEGARLSVALVGHALDVLSVYCYGRGVSTAMAVHTAGCVALLGVGALRLGEPGTVRR